MKEKMEKLNAKRAKIQKILSNTDTKKDRQKTVKLLVKFKQNQKKVYFHAKDLSDHLLKMSPYMRKLLFMTSSDPLGMQQLIDCPKVFEQGLIQARAHLKAARKRVKNKDYKP